MMLVRSTTVLRGQCCATQQPRGRGIESSQRTAPSPRCSCSSTPSLVSQLCIRSICSRAQSTVTQTSHDSHTTAKLT